MVPYITIIYKSTSGIIDNNYVIVSHIVCIYRLSQLSRDYCTKREVFGNYLADNPLHMHTLAEMEVMHDIYVFTCICDCVSMCLCACPLCLCVYVWVFV